MFWLWVAGRWIGPSRLKRDAEIEKLWNEPIPWEYLRKAWY